MKRTHSVEFRVGNRAIYVQNLILFAALLIFVIIAVQQLYPSAPRNPYRDLSEALLRDEPYFGEAMAAGQAQPKRTQHFIDVLRTVAHDGSVQMIEIGPWAGQSTVIWAKAIRELKLSGKLIAVDPWLPYFDTKVNTATMYATMNQAASDGLIYRLFLHNIKAAGVSDLIDTRIGKSADVLPGITDHSIDLIYIDGSHVYANVIYDVQQAKRLVRSGGIICGDDLEIQARDLTEEKIQADVASGLDYTSHWSTGYYHPGVTAAVAKELDHVEQQDGFWWTTMP
jgi:predicted O-methyltransferase YrrM